MQSGAQLVVIVGTGGTIAGTVGDGAAGTIGQSAGHLAYRAGALDVDALIDAVPALRSQPLQALSLAQIDSCDMDHSTWAALRSTLQQQLARPEVAGVVVTHGTDTLEETAYFLHRTLAAGKPVVLTAAMRPATAPSADGPQNLLDAVTLARTPGAQGVLVVLAGRVHAGAELRKLHGYRVDAFSSGDAGVLGLLEDGRPRLFRAWPAAPLHAAAAQLPGPAAWPVVDIVTSHAGAQARTLDALVAAGAAGVVIAGTGNGTVHHQLRAAARRALAAGVPVRRASRCLEGGVVDGETEGAGGPADGDSLRSAATLTPVQARIELMLDLIAARLPTH